MLNVLRAVVVAECVLKNPLSYNIGALNNKSQQMTFFCDVRSLFFLRVERVSVDTNLWIEAVPRVATQ
jgi:hypothetical protein